jgi:hypothetical protein
MRREFFRRIERLERGWDGNEPKLLRIRGGLGGLPGAPYHAQIGTRVLLPLPGENDADFCDRALDAAADLGEGFVIVSGTLPWQCA